jgi:hypothetical protein
MCYLARYVCIYFIYKLLEQVGVLEEIAKRA